VSRRNKLLKFAEIGSFGNVYQNFSVSAPQLIAKENTLTDLRGQWASTHFNNDNPITLELACGRGEYTVGLAEMFPERNFIGVDIKGARIWKGAKQALALNLNNAAFLRTRIECVDAFFAPGEVDEIWITFPDPFPRIGQSNRRLTANVFLDLYRKILTSTGKIHLKTDNTGIFLSTLEIISACETCAIHLLIDDIDAQSPLMPELSIPTYYERVHRQAGARIKYVCFSIQQ
jgi:tRNA (guanine-N7-)-methyltransferase